MKTAITTIALVACLSPWDALACKCKLPCDLTPFVGAHVSQDATYVAVRQFTSHPESTTPLMEENLFSLIREGDAEPVEVEVLPSSDPLFVHVSVPPNTWTAGERWHLNINAVDMFECQFDAQTISFDVVDTMPTGKLSLELGSGTRRERSMIHGASCEAPKDAVHRTATMALSPELAPHAGNLRLELLVDGEPYVHRPSLCGPQPSAQLLPRMTRNIVAACDGSSTLDPGVHTVQARAWRIGDSEPLLVSDLQTFDLTCGVLPGTACSTTPNSPPPPSSPLLLLLGAIFGVRRLTRKP